MSTRMTFVALDTAPLKGALAVGHGLLGNETLCIVESRHAPGMSRSPKIPSTRLWHPLNVPLPPAPLRAAGSSIADARSAAQPSSPPRSPLGQQSRRLSKRAFKRTAQPAGPTPCWSPRLEGARGSGTFKGCQRPLRRGYWAFANRPDESDTTCETDPPQAEMPHRHSPLREPRSMPGLWDA